MADTPHVLTKRATVAVRRATLPVLRRARPQHYTDAAPFRVLDVQTSRITHLQRRWSGPIELPWMEGSRIPGSLRRRWHAGTVLDGDWDLAITPIEDYHLTRVLRARLLDGAPWDHIPYVRRALAKVRAGGVAWGGRCKDVHDVHARCRYLDRLAAELSATGYAPHHSRRTGTVSFTHFLINVGRDGTIIRNNDGKHRIIVAQLLGIPLLQARVLVRHRRWQKLRTDIRAGAQPPAGLEDHPDLSDLLART